MHLNIFQDSDQFQALISVAREQLLTIRTHPSPSPAPDSPPWLAFDPAIARRLNSFAPLRIVEPPTPEATWESISALLDGLEELYLLSNTTNVSTWEVTCWLFCLQSAADVYCRQLGTFGRGGHSYCDRYHTYGRLPKSAFSAAYCHLSNV